MAYTFISQYPFGNPVLNIYIDPKENQDLIDRALNKNNYNKKQKPIDKGLSLFPVTYKPITKRVKK